MNRRPLTVARKTLGDFTRLRFLLFFYVPFTLITVLITQGAASGTPDGFGSFTLRAQEEFFTQVVATIAFTWAFGIPTMVLVAVLVANAIASEEQSGTLRILLSKPVKRWEYLLGKYLAIVLFTYLVMISCLFVSVACVYFFGPVSPVALGNSFFALLPAYLVYALLVAVFLTTIGTTAATVTANRLRTALATVAVPGLFFAFLFARTFSGRSGVYEDFSLYLIDVNYHLGNVFVFVVEAFGVSLSPQTQAGLGTVTGVFDATQWGRDPLVGGFSGSVPLTGYVPAVASLALVVVVAVGLLGVALYHFEHKDIS